MAAVAAGREVRLAVEVVVGPGVSLVASEAGDVVLSANL